MSIDADHLATRLTAAISATPGAGGDAMGWLWPALLRELARGRPVTINELARVTGRSAAQVHDGLAGLSDTEYDSAGAVIGHGITLRETPHRFTVDGHELYTWCALDTLIFPTVLGRPAQVVSPAPGTGEPVTLSVDPAAGITALEPPTAVVSVLVPDSGSSGVRTAFCDQVHFFATPAAAQNWLTEHPGGTVLTVADAFELGRRLAHDLVAGRPGCCRPDRHRIPPTYWSRRTQCLSRRRPGRSSVTAAPERGGCGPAMWAAGAPTRSIRQVRRVAVGTHRPEAAAR